MSQLKDLQTIADKKLSGLKATPQMLGEIKLKVAGGGGKKAPSISLRPILAVCTALLLVAGIVTWAVDTKVPGPEITPSVFDSQPAGGVEANGSTPTEAPQQDALDISPGNITLGSEGEAPAYRSIFAPGQGGNFPLVKVGNATYRLLTQPGSVSEGLLGESLSQVTEFTLEPALGTSSTISNTVAQGDQVYAIVGMEGAMVAARVDGTLRAFQRVSFAGTAVVGSETLADTLCAPSQVQSMELSGVGAITDSAVASRLMEVLLSEAVYQGSGSASGSQSLLLSLSNGLTLQLMVGEDSVSACGTWSCPEFFEAFGEALGQ